MSRIYLTAESSLVYDVMKKQPYACHLTNKCREGDSKYDICFTSIDYYVSQC